MKFLIVAGFADSIIQFRGSFIDALLERGMTVHVAAPSLYKNTTIYNVLTEKGVKVHTFPMNRTGLNLLSDLKTLLSLLRLMAAICPSHVFAYTIKPAIYGTLAATIMRVPNRNVLITGLGYAFQGDGNRSVLRSLVTLLYRFALCGASKVFFQNPDDASLFHRLKILRANAPVSIVNGSGVNLSEFKTTPLPYGARFLLIGRLLSTKGVREYVMAARRVKACYPETQFSLVGWLDQNPASISKEELNRWIADGICVFLGRLSDVRPAIEEANVYVLPSYREGTPRTVLEAMAMGRPIITTDAPGCRETVIDGENGFLVPVKSVDRLVGAMVSFITIPSLKHRMGACSRRLAEDKYDVHKVNSVMLREMGIL